MTPTTLSHDELDQVLQRVAPQGREFGAARICRLLAAEHSVYSVRINMRCALSNISDVVSKGVNSKIRDLGLRVGCVKPPVPILNRYGQPTGMCLWSFYRTEAANDPEYPQESLEDALTRDYSAMSTDFMQGDDLPTTALDDDLEAFAQRIASVDLDFEFAEIDCLPAGDGTEVPGGSR